MKDYGTLSLSELKEELKSRGARLSGRKKELVERLESYDRNFNFGKANEVEKEYEMFLPPISSYRDINQDSDFPPVNLASVNAYLGFVGQEIDEKTKQLFDQRFLKYLRLANDTDFHVRSECKAEMKKTVSYKVDVKIDKNGSIGECQCECAVGMGPTAHCKHIRCVLYACYKFSTSNIIQTEETCTQKLQTFHQTKPFHRSPLKAKHLPLSANINVNFEPRPTKYRKKEGYPDQFRNVWLNHIKINEFPVSHFCDPANTYAVDRDHDYLKSSLSDMWLDRNHITSITTDYISDIEKITRGQSNNQDWCNERRKRLHSSIFGRICTATERTDRDKLALSLVKPPQELKTQPILHGKRCESVALQKYEKLTKVETTPCGTFVCAKYPYLASSPDAVIDDDRLVEVKCPYTARNEMITPETVPYLQEEHGQFSLKTTHPYYYQVQGQLLCSGRKQCVFILYTFEDLKFFIVQRDEEFIEEMVKKLKSFFEEYFKKAVLNQFYFKNYNRLTFGMN
ncbi:hypothetical protein ScPMuIL_015155 [Solemya velum]